MVDYIRRVLNAIFYYFTSFFGVKSIQDKNLIKIFVQTNIGEKVCLSLKSDWTVDDVKNHVANQLNTTKLNLKIIFAGKELPDDLPIGLCDLGNQSILHAVRIETANAELKTDSPEKIGLPESHESFSEEDSCKTLGDSASVLRIQLNDNELKEISRLKGHETTNERKPHFYVYCSDPCSSVRIGKLRVRCALCKSGAFTVLKDPSSWNDVLNPNQIPGKCANLNCGGNWTEFFFKCSEHQTQGESDISVPLNLLRSNTNNWTCLACSDVSSPVVFFTCSHLLCLECFVAYCLSRLNERHFTYDTDVGYTLPCPMNCPSSLVKEPHHFKLIGEQNYARYQKFGAEEAVLSMGGILCPQPGCGQGIIPDLHCTRIKCEGGCEFVFCKNCLQGYHIGECAPDPFDPGPETSGSLFQVASNFQNIDPTNLTIKTTCKPCPKCRTPTERDGGCMHMICTRSSCSFNWCWVCQTEWTRDCMSSHWFN